MRRDGQRYPAQSNSLIENCNGELKHHCLRGRYRHEELVYILHECVLTLSMSRSKGVSWLESPHPHLPGGSGVEEDACMTIWFSQSCLCSETPSRNPKKGSGNFFMNTWMCWEDHALGRGMEISVHSLPPPSLELALYISSSWNPKYSIFLSSVSHTNEL